MSAPVRRGEGAVVPPEIPDTALAAGLVAESAGVHTSRTLMLVELRLLLAACPATTNVEGYRTAVVEENVLLKRTATTRRATFKWVRQLYALDTALPIFGALRHLWEADAAGQSTLAILCAVARDPMLRATAPVVLDCAPGAELPAPRLAEAIEAAYLGRFNAGSLRALGSHTASSWQQSGHLTGKVRKVRATVQPTPASTAYALLLGHLCDERGVGLFATLWARLLDAPPSALDAQAFAAAQRGWLDYRRIGEIADFGFSALLTTSPGEDNRGER